MKTKKDRLLSLNEKTLQAERSESENWLLAKENERRTAKKLDNIKKLSDLEELLEKDSQAAQSVLKLKPYSPKRQSTA